MKQSLFLSAATLSLQFGISQALVGGRSNNVALSRAVRLAGEGEGPFSFQSPYNINNKRICTGYWRVGCTHDVQTAKRVWYHKSIPKEDREPVSVEMCWNFCKNVSGSQYFGLENGDRCYCTPYFEDDHAYNDDICDMPCVGNFGEMCGNQRLQSMWQMHDCNNLPPVPCGTPPGPVLNAKLFNSTYYQGQTPCDNTQGNKPLDATTNLLCSVECLPGFQLKSNDIKCRERGNRLTYSWSQVVGSAVCAPLHCGTLGSIPHARYAARVFQFLETTQVTCDLGFEPNSCVGQPGCGNAVTVDCLATQFFNSTDALGNSISGPPSCARKPCGECDQPGNTTLKNAVPAEKVYQDLCKYDCDEGYSLNQKYPGTSWYETKCGASGNFSVPAKTCLPVSCDAYLLRPFSTNPSNGVDLNKVTFGQAVLYECDQGYSTTGKYGDAREFNSTCDYDGRFAATAECKPNFAGRPPHVNNSDYEDKDYYFGEVVTYTCHNGYALATVNDSLTAGPAEDWIGTVPVCDPVDCGAPPTFGNSTAVNASATMHFESPALTYECAPGYSTNRMDDLWNPIDAHLTVSCQANGNFTEPPKMCQNMDDCQLHTCGAYGTCEDLPIPTGIPIDDYTCNCIDGYEITLHPSRHHNGTEMKVCTNINDCPVAWQRDNKSDACGGFNRNNKSRGLCIDGVNNYTCTPSAGYEVTFLPNLPANETCTPIACGTVNDVGNATLAPAGLAGQTADWDTPKWTFTCNTGHSLTGLPSAAATQEVYCQATGEMTDVPECKPISCGVPAVVSNSEVLPQLAEVFFPTKLTYTCDVGHALEGNASGDLSFTAECMASGSPKYDPPAVVGIQTRTSPPTAAISDVPSCEPVKCGKAPDKTKATWNEDKNFTYPEAALYTCDEGWSTNGTAGFDTFKLKCLPTALFSNHCFVPHDCTVEESRVRYPEYHCERVECTVPPVIASTSGTFKRGAYVYEDVVNYTVEPGYEIQVTVNGITSMTRDPFSCECGSGGEWTGACGNNISTQAIDCGTPAPITNATITGDTKFASGGMTATCDVGYTTTGLAGGTTIFNFRCKANGLFSAREECLPINCGFSKAIQHGTGSMDVFSPPSHFNAKQGGSFEGYIKDTVTYSCSEGYRASSVTPQTPIQEVLASAPAGFLAECTTSGGFNILPGGVDSIGAPANANLNNDTDCYPVTCDAGNTTHANAMPNLVVGHTFVRMEFDSRHQFDCDAGFSLNATPWGRTTFQEDCTKTGDMTNSVTCSAIDWCLDGKCGATGKCVNGNLQYSCTCDAGYEVYNIDAAHEACRPILECDTHSGHANCGPGGGSCIDEILKYKCNCTSGYEVLLDWELLETCSPVVCPVTPVVANGASQDQGSKLVYPNIAAYACNSGYNTDGNVGSPTSFQIECQADATLRGLVKTAPVSALPQCHPISCGQAPELLAMSIVGNATAVFGESVTWTCDEGRTLSGVVGTASSKIMPCQGVPWPPLSTSPDGHALAPYPKCQKIECPYIRVNDATAVSVLVIHFNDTLEYTCATGYETPGGADKFKATCEANGTLTGIESCQRVSCGPFPTIEQATFSSGTYVYEDEIVVTCAVGHHANGGGTFKVTCGADEKYSNLPSGKKCIKRSCGVPQPCPLPSVACHAAPTQTSEMFYQDSADWDCNGGYTTDGTPSGDGGFSQECGADGNFVPGVPAVCQDIDFCSVGQPCGAVGVCADSGPGMVNPGYGCTCPLKYEVKLSTEGLPSCHMDDCQHDFCHPGPKGQGGTCQDLSKTGGAQDQYACTCMLGYDAAFDPERCIRKSCGTFPKIHNTDYYGSKWYDVTTWKGEAVILDTYVGQPVVNSYDIVKYKCAQGYSTDGSRNSQAKSFSVTCDAATGDSKRPLNPTGECQPMTCPEAEVPVVANAQVTTAAPYWNDGSATYKCDDGHTIDGQVQGKNFFTVSCTSGSFGTPSKSCQKISCTVDVAAATSTLSPQRDGTGVDAQLSTTSVLYEKEATLICAPNYGINNDVAKDRVTGTCKMDGSFGPFTIGAGLPDQTMADWPSCEPVSCGAVPSQRGTKQFGTAAETLYGIVGYNMNTKLTFDCQDNYTLDGALGAMKGYIVECDGTTGKLSGSICNDDGSMCKPGGPVNGLHCKLTKVPVHGKITDAENGAVHIVGALLVFWQGKGRDAVKVGTAVSDQNGEYKVDLPLGDTIIMSTATAQNYIDREKGPISVTGPISPGQGADVSMSKVLDYDDWRIVLTWNEQPQDLDSQTIFGAEEGNMVNFMQRTASSNVVGSHEMVVTLDRDAATGYGPETTTVKGAGTCVAAGCCLLRFQVKKQPTDSWATSGATVTVYKGAARAAKYRVPLCLTDGVWDVFTIDTSARANVLLLGKWGPGPYVSMRDSGEQVWALTNTQWAPWTSGSGTFLYGMEVQRAMDPNILQIQTASYLGGAQASQCSSVDTLGFGTDKMITCQPGEFLSSFKMKAISYPDSHGMQQINEVKCCGWTGSSLKVWGTCSVIDVDASGDIACPQTVAEPTALVGFQGKHGSMPFDPNAAAPVTPKHVTWTDGVYIGGEYLQIGVRSNTEIGKVGTDGTGYLAPPDFYKRPLPLTAQAKNSWGIGYMGNAKGFSNDVNGEFTIDYFLPGTRDESFNFGYKIAGTETTCMNDCGTKVEDTTVEGSGIASLRVSGQMGDLSFNITYELENEDTFVKTTVEFENVGAIALDDVMFMRSVDPDNTVDHTFAGTELTVPPFASQADLNTFMYSAFKTENTVLRTVAADGYAAVSATSQPNDMYFKDRGKRAMLTYFSRDPSAIVSIFRPWKYYAAPYAAWQYQFETAPNGNVYNSQVYDAAAPRSKSNTLDGWISIAFKIDQLTPGEKKQVQFYTSMDDRPVDEQIANLAAKSVPAILMEKIKCCGFQKMSNIEDNPTCHTGA